jgi:hypothetical protein
LPVGGAVDNIAAMLGNSPDVLARGRVRLALVGSLIATFVLAGCPKNVKQDAKTGSDGKYKGAKTVTLENLEGEASGIVTYPGGDRVDWKLIELPEGKVGALTLELSWRPPRPGLDLAFDVYNEWGRKLGGVKPKKPSAAKKSKRKRGKKSVTIDGVRGKIYVEVYASNRGDAGKYKLKVAFAETTVAEAKTFDLTGVSIPDPPKLAAVYPQCDLQNIDEKNPDCQGKSKPCDLKNFDPSLPDCAGKCPDPKKPDPAIEGCVQYFPPCDPDAIDKTNPRCTDVKATVKPIDGRIMAAEVTGGGTIIHINKGTKDLVDRNWTGTIVDGTGKPVQNGSFTIYKAQEKKSYAKVKLSRDVVNKNLGVKLYPP